MLRKAVPYLILGSVALNLAFVGVWFVHAWPFRADAQSDEQPGIWCPLHRQLEVSPEQWAQIEPLLREFQATVDEHCQKVNSVRSEVIELIAADKPDRDAIRAKQDEILDIKRKIQDLVADHLLAEREILTPEQQSRLFDMLGRRTDCGPNPPLSGRGAKNTTGRGMGQVLREPAKLATEK